MVNMEEMVSELYDSVMTNFSDLRLTNFYSHGNNPNKYHSRFRTESMPHKYGIWSRYKMFEEVVSEYVQPQLERIAQETGYFLKTKVINHIFRSRIKVEGPGIKMTLRVPKFTYLFGFRIKGKLKKLRNLVRRQQVVQPEPNYIPAQAA